SWADFRYFGHRWVTVSGSLHSSKQLSLWPKMAREGSKVAYDPRRALELLQIGSGSADANFRDGQEDAIRHIVEGKGRLLVVQKTGWGKSVV
ncbi:ATP-dependent DNA helicase RecG, partial [Pseudomonas aeruginosa]|nr:ATP-dependent DNA helicase RecG [Pseudomonas aeruginosa]